jgi:hypothetical protein
LNLALRHEYLQAMGIDIWLPRLTSAPVNKNPATARVETADVPEASEKGTAETALAGRIVVGPGGGSTLLLCGRSEDASTALAADIARSLDCEPVWAWPAPGPAAAGTTLGDAIKEHLFTRVLVFGQEQLTPAMERKAGFAGSAQLIWTDPIPVLMESGAARRRLWQELSACQWCAGWTGTP